jgi:hypothetical protein
MSADERDELIEALGKAIGDRLIVVNAPPIMVKTAEAARMLGMGEDLFRREVAPDIRRWGRGRAGKGEGRAVRLYLVDDLRRWAAENADRMGDY